MRIAQPLNEYLAGEGASRKSEQVSLSKEALEALQALKQACMNSPALALPIILKIFYLKQMLLRRDWGQFFPRNKKMDSSTQWPMAARHSPHRRRTTILLS